MALTPSQSRLEDVQAKEKFARESIYDYSNPVQGKIQSFVETELEFFPNKDNVVPRAGRHTINGSISFKVKQKDIDAYCAAHPQVCVPAAKREEIYNNLVSGGTTIPQPEPIKPESKEFIPTPMFPPLPTSATHKIVLEESNLNAVYRVSPVSTATYVAFLEPNQQLIVLDEAVGVNGEFAEVLRLDLPPSQEPTFVLKDFIAPLPQTPKSAEYKVERQSRRYGTYRRWTDLEVNVPSLNFSTGKYEVSVETKYDSTGGDKLAERMKEALPIGLKLILEENGKKSDDETINRLLSENYFIFARAEDYYVDSKAKMPMRVLVTLPTKYISPLEDKEEEPEFDFSIQVPLKKFEEIVKDKNPKKIKILGDKMKGFDGEIQTFDAAKESKNLEDYYYAITDLIDSSDDSSTDSADFIVLGWKNGFEATYVALLDQKNNKKIVMKKGMTSFKKQASVESKRTQELVFKMRQFYVFMGDWEEFLKEFVTVEPVSVIHNNKNKDKKPAAEVGPSVKSVEEMRREERYFDDDARKIEIYDERKKQSTTVALFGRAAEEFPKTANQVSSLDDAYERVLNNVNLPFLISEALACLGDVSGLRRDVRSTLGFLSQIHTIPSAIFPDDLPTDDISSAYVKTLKNTLENMISTMLISMVKGILGNLTGGCDDDVPTGEKPSLQDLLGAMGKMEGEFDRDKATSFIDDLFNILTPLEICQLLEGNPTDKTLQIAQSLLARLYPELKMETKSQITDFFSTLGSLIDFQVCRNILDEQIPDTDLKVEDFLCEDLNDLLREELLRSKGEMTEDQIKEQLERDRLRNEQLRSQLLAALENGPLAEKFQTPDLFCAKDSGSTGVASFVDESFSLMLRETLEGLFGPISTSFNKEGDQFASTTLEQVQFEKIVEIAGIETTLQLFRNEPVPQFKNIVRTSIPRQELPSDNTESFTLFVRSSAESEELTIVDEQIAELQSKIDLANLTIATLEGLGIARENQTRYEVKIKFEERISQIEDGINSLNLELASAIYNERSTEEINERINLNRALIEDLRTSIELFTSLPENKTISEQVDEYRQQRQELLPLTSLSGNALNPKEVTYDFNYNASRLDEGRKVTRIVVARDEGSNDVIIVEEQLNPSIMNYFRDNGLIVAGQTPSRIFANLFRNRFANFVSQEDLQIIEENTRTSVYNMIKNKFLREISDRVISSPYFKKLKSDNENGAYGIELINLTPQTENPECDVHLLRVNSLIKEVEGEFDSDFCLDYDSLNDTTGDQKNPMEAAIMEACVRLTSRHYLVEMLLKSVFTMSAFDSTMEFNKIKFSFIKDMIKISMLEYSAQYYDDFLIEVHEIIGAATKEESFVEMLKQEYEVIIEPLQIALLLPKSRPSVARGIIEKIINETDESLRNHELGRRLIKERIIKLQFEKQEDREHNRFFYDRGRGPDPRVIRVSQLERYQLYVNGLINRGIFTKAQIEKATTIVDSISLVEDSVSEIGYNSMDNFSKQKGFYLGLSEEELTGINTQTNKPRFVVPIAEVSTDYLKIVKGRSDSEMFENEEQISDFDLSEFMDSNEVRILLDFFFPIEDYKATFTIHEIVSLSTNQDIRNAFSVTRDELNSLFYTITPEKDDWKKQNPNLRDTSAEDITSIVDLEFGVKDTPCGELSWNLGLNVGWGKAYKGFNFAFAAKAAKDAALQTFKDYVEQNDPNIKLARQLAFLSKLACVNVPTTVYSAPLSFVPGLAPTQLTYLYNALGLGVYDKNRTKTADELNELGLDERDPCTGESTGRQQDAIEAGRLAEQEAVIATREQERQDRIASTQNLLREKEDEYSLLVEQRNEVVNNRANYTSPGRRSFDDGDRWYPDELLEEPKIQYNILQERIEALLSEINRIRTELSELSSSS